MLILSISSFSNHTLAKISEKLRTFILSNTFGCVWLSGKNEKVNEKRKKINQNLQVHYCWQKPWVAPLICKCNMHIFSLVLYVWVDLMKNVSLAELCSAQLLYWGRFRFLRGTNKIADCQWHLEAECIQPCYNIWDSCYFQSRQSRILGNSRCKRSGTISCRRFIEIPIMFGYKLVMQWSECLNQIYCSWRNIISQGRAVGLYQWCWKGKKCHFMGLDQP